MKYYAFQFVCILASVAFIIWRPAAPIAILVVGAVIIIASCVLTKIGKDNAVDDMWWRIAIAILAPLLIGLSQAS